MSTADGTEGQDPVDTPEGQPGPLQAEKRGESAEPGSPQPEAAEVESARTLANQARAELAGAGLSDDRIRELADDYVARDRGDDLAAFVRWAKEHA